MPVTQAVMYQAAKYAGIEKPCGFDSGGHVTFAMKLVELNLFVWILYCSWDHYIGDEDKKMEKNVLPKVVNFIRTVRRWERAYYKRRNPRNN